MDIDTRHQKLAEIFDDPEAVKAVGSQISMEIREGMRAAREYWHSLPLGTRLFGDEEKIMAEFWLNYKKKK